MHASTPVRSASMLLRIEEVLVDEILQFWIVLSNRLPANDEDLVYLRIGERLAGARPGPPFQSHRRAPLSFTPSSACIAEGLQHEAVYDTTPTTRRGTRSRERTTDGSPRAHARVARIVNPLSCIGECGVLAHHRGDWRHCDWTAARHDRLGAYAVCDRSERSANAAGEVRSPSSCSRRGDRLRLLPRRRDASADGGNPGDVAVHGVPRADLDR